MFIHYLRFIIMGICVQIVNKLQKKYKLLKEKKKCTGRKKETKEFRQKADI